MKLLGYGMYGTVYKIHYQGHVCAMKIEHILESNVEKNLKSPVWREIEFAEKFGNKYPDFFLKLYKHEIIDKCFHTQKFITDPDLFSTYKKENFININESPYCVKKIYSYVNYSLNKIIDKLNVKQIYSMLIQVYYALYLLHKHKYTHNDLHAGNIGVVKTNQKYFKIGTRKIPTFGYRYKIIDYGAILNKKYPMNAEEKKNYKYNIKYEHKHIKNLIVYDKFYDYIIRKKYSHFSISEEFKKSKENKLLKKITGCFEDRKFLFKIMFPKNYQQLKLKENFNRVIKPKLYIPIDDIIFIIQNSKSVKKIITYFLKLL